MTDRIEAAALALRAARASRAPIAQVSATYGIATLDEAYAVAGRNVAARLATGARIVGRKIGLTSKTVQMQLGIDEPDFGIIFDDMEYLDRGEVPIARLIQPKAEVEIAFVFGRDLSGEAPSYGAFLAALAYALPAVEVVDSAIVDWKITLFDTVADNASSGLYVLGDQPVDIGRLSFAELGARLDKNGVTESIGVGAACLGHPLRAAYWLARTTLSRGDVLRAGEVILSGALGPMVSVSAGDVLYARVGELGSVSFRMV